MIAIKLYTIYITIIVVKSILKSKLFTKLNSKLKVLKQSNVYYYYSRIQILNYNCSNEYIDYYNCSNEYIDSYVKFAYRQFHFVTLVTLHIYAST